MKGKEEESISDNDSIRFGIFCKIGFIRYLLYDLKIMHKEKKNRKKISKTRQLF